MAHDGSTAQQPQQQMLLWLNLLARSMSTTDEYREEVRRSQCRQTCTPCAVTAAHSPSEMSSLDTLSVFGGGRAAETTQMNKQHSIQDVYK
jgi:hypothetical protein